MGVNLDIIKMSDPQANHYGATTDINVKLMEAMEDHVTEGALQPSHFYTSYLPGKVMFLTFLPESCARILLERMQTFVVPASACTYRLAARAFETLDFDKRKEQEGQNYGNVILREGYPPNAKVIQDGATAHLDRIGLKFNSIHNRTDDGGFPTREWRIGWTVTERFQYPEVASISNMKIGGIEMLFKPSDAFCAEMGLHSGKKGCFKFLKPMKMSITRTCQCSQTGTGAGSSSGGKAVKRTAQASFRQRSMARKAPQGF